MSMCALVGAVDFNAEDFLARHAAGAFDFVIAVDAGFAHLEGVGVVPDMAVGDFDSLGYVPKCRRVSRHPVKKDKSDMELAMEKAVTWGHDELVVYGALSGRLDHTLANLQLFAKFSERTRPVRDGRGRRLRRAAAHRAGCLRVAGRACRRHRVGVFGQRRGARSHRARAGLLARR